MTKLVLSVSAILPPTVIVDGKSKPTLNSAGLPIAGSVDHVVNFWSWFGDSKAVDTAGRPKVFYHGTDKDIAVFRASPRGNLGSGIYLTDSRAEAESYTHDVYSYPNHTTGGNVVPLYAKIVNPYVWTDDDSYEVDSVAHQVKVARNRGHDSVTYSKRRGKVTHCVVFSPYQLKSAVGNSGRFNPDSEAIDK